MTPRLSLGTRLLLGGIAGFVATLPMSMVVRLAHRRLPARERYPAPPRELIDVAAEGTGVKLAEEQARDLTMAAHYLYGAASGAAIAALVPRPGIATGAAAGVAVWGASYFGWIPALGLLEPADAHPARRNAMMIGAHLVWGGAMALTLRELLAGRGTIIAAGRDRDAAR